MKRTVEIIASFTGTIPTGSFENEKPFYSVKEVIELEQTGEVEAAHSEMTDEKIAVRQKQLHDICYAQFKRQADVAFQDRLAATYKNIRWYPGKDGIRYPSVTSIIGWDADFHVTPDELAQYSSRGTIIHKQVEVFLSTGEWKEPKDIPEIYPDLVIVKNGTLSLETDNVDFQQFYKDFPFKVVSLEDTLLNHELKYGGRRDIKCIIEKDNPGKWAKLDGILFDVPTILDVKTGAIDKTKCFKQQTAYWHCDDEVQQVGIIPLNKDNKCGYSKPLVIADKEKYWHLFLKDLDNFGNRYGLK